MSKTEAVPGGALQEQQRALMEAAYAEPSVATVMEALDRLYPHFPATVVIPMYKTTLGIGTNSTS